MDEDQIRKAREEGKVIGQSFDFPISDSDFADIVDKRVEEIDKKWKQLSIAERSKRMVDFWKGKQMDETQLYEYQRPVAYKNNLIYRDEEKRISIIASKLPDVVVTPVDETHEKRDHALAIEKGLNIKMAQRIFRPLVKDVLRNHDLQFVGVIKVVWNKESREVEYKLVDPSKVIIDMTATIPHDGFTADNMEVIIEWVEEPVAQVIAKFPSKKEEIMQSGGGAKKLNAKMRYQEIWFSFYGNDGKLYEGTGWKNKKVVYGIEKNSYFDWEGYEKGTDKGKELVYRNHFDRPRKPYIFVSYQNLGDSPLDATTHVEQSLPLQTIVNKRGMQITEIADRTVPKLAALADAITKEDLRRITNDPNEHISLGGTLQDIQKGIMTIQATGPSPVLYQDLLSNRAEIDALFATQSTTRGATVPHESGVSKQITKEGDLESHDDMSKVVVERIMYEAANWTVHLWKLFFEKPQFIRNMGKDGEGVYIELKRDIIDDGIGVNVQSSTTDKAQRRFDAQTAAARRQIDPLTYWEMLDSPNPKETTRRLIAFLSGDFKTYFDITDLTSFEDKDNGKAEALVDIERLKQGDDFEPSVPTPAYLMTMIEYTGSGDYKKQPDKVKGRFKEFMDKLRKKHEETYMPQDTMGMQPGGQQPQPPMAPGGGGQQIQGSPAQPSMLPVTGQGAPQMPQ